MAHGNPVPRLYHTVVEDVISNVRESFLDEGVDESILQELKQLWEGKLAASKAVEGGGSGQTVQHLRKQQHQQQQVLLLQQQQQQLQRIGKSTANQIPERVQYAHIVNTNMSGAATTATMALPGHLYQQQMAAQFAQGGITLQQNSQGQIIAVPQGQILPGQGQVLRPQTSMQAGLPTTTAAFTIQQAPRAPTAQPSQNTVVQLDGANDTSSEDEDDDADDDDNDEEEQGEEENGDGGEEEDPLNSGDDISEEDPSEIFDTDNVVVCQYDKINRNKNKWKFHLKDGIMNLNGTDYVFQKANGEAEW